MWVGIVFWLLPRFGTKCTEPGGFVIQFLSPRRMDAKNTHPKPGPGLLANAGSHIATLSGCMTLSLRRCERSKNNQSWFRWRERTCIYTSYGICDVIWYDMIWHDMIWYDVIWWYELQVQPFSHIRNISWPKSAWTSPSRDPSWGPRFSVMWWFRKWSDHWKPWPHDS